jgi:hypothetical protein
MTILVADAMMVWKNRIVSVLYRNRPMFHLDLDGRVLLSIRVVETVAEVYVVTVAAADDFDWTAHLETAVVAPVDDFDSSPESVLAAVHVGPGPAAVAARHPAHHHSIPDLPPAAASSEELPPPPENLQQQLC